MSASSGAERREAEAVIAYWEGKQAAFSRGAAVTPLALDLGAMRADAWSHRFLMALGSSDDDTALLRYGENFARLFQIPPESEPPLPTRQWLPERLREVFIGGCRQAIERNHPVRLQRIVQREDGQREMFRCCFIPLSAPQSLAARFVLGAYSSRLADPPGG
jgi:hypothetical protein